MIKKTYIIHILLINDTAAWSIAYYTIMIILVLTSVCQKILVVAVAVVFLLSLPLFL